MPHQDHVNTIGSKMGKLAQSLDIIDKGKEKEERTKKKKR